MNPIQDGHFRQKSVRPKTCPTYPKKDPKNI